MRMHAAALVVALRHAAAAGAPAQKAPWSATPPVDLIQDGTLKLAKHRARVER